MVNSKYSQRYRIREMLFCDLFIFLNIYRQQGFSTQVWNSYLRNTCASWCLCITNHMVHGCKLFILQMEIQKQKYGFKEQAYTNVIMIF